MKPLLVMLLLAASVQAQSLVDAARKEKERQSKLQSTRVLVVDNSKSEAAKPKTEDTKSDETKQAQETPKPQAPADPVKLWNEQLDQLRAKIRTLQDQELALLLQQNDLTNQVYAVIQDPTTQERSQSQLAQIQQQVAAVRADLNQAQKTLDQMLLEGPPKK